MKRKIAIAAKPNGTAQDKLMPRTDSSLIKQNASINNSKGHQKQASNGHHYFATNMKMDKK
jgi:hypothetical protein